MTWWPGGDPDAYGGLLRDIDEGYSKRIAIVVPPGAVWPLPAYELALMTAGEARDMGHDDVSVTVVTPERRALSLFGDEASDGGGRGAAQRRASSSRPARSRAATAPGSCSSPAASGSTSSASSPSRGSSGRRSTASRPTRKASSVAGDDARVRAASAPGRPATPSSRR